MISSALISRCPTRRIFRKSYFMKMNGQHFQVPRAKNKISYKSCSKYAWSRIRKSWGAGAVVVGISLSSWRGFDVWNLKMKEGKFLLGHFLIYLLVVLHRVSLSNFSGFVVPWLTAVQENSQGQCMSLVLERWLCQRKGDCHRGLVPQIWAAAEAIEEGPGVLKGGAAKWHWELVDVASLFGSLPEPTDMCGIGGTET